LKAKIQGTFWKLIANVDKYYGCSLGEVYKVLEVKNSIVKCSTTIDLKEDDEDIPTVAEFYLSAFLIDFIKISNKDLKRISSIKDIIS